MKIYEVVCILRKVLLIILLFSIVGSYARMNHCYLSDGTAQRCLPPFVNAAFGKKVDASDTCGTPPEEYCLQTGATGVTKSCHICDRNISSKNHDSVFLTDVNNGDVSTWWQSKTMLHEVQYPNMVNLTLHLNKAFDITYVRLLFHTSRPESFAIYKKKCDECEWQPFQYYSGTCFSTFGIDNKEIVTAENEQKALCTDDYSDISPLTGGNVAFSTLESRPSAYNFDKSHVLQDWVKAVAIKITLNRINTFGDEVFRDPKILKSYYYGISDLSVGGRCACNGHASSCYVGPDNIMKCHCEHNTAGRDCERCEDMFNDRPWIRGSRDNPGECKACNCNGLSENCYFDMDLYQSTGSGGHCTNCTKNTDGPNCAYCKPNYYNSSGICVNCECNSIGSLRPQCDSSGRCFCKPGVTGDKCDRCLPNYYRFDESGCRQCYCAFEGTVSGTICDASTGDCFCKMNVEGKNCDKCKPATMNLQDSNPYGCTACFCYGHSSVCEVSTDYTIAFIISNFTRNDHGWVGRNELGGTEPLLYDDGSISMGPSSHTATYFSAPKKFLGRQRFSYNQFFEFDLRIEKQAVELGSGSDDYNDSGSILNGNENLILIGDGFQVAAPIISQENPAPGEEFQRYRFRLHEEAGFFPKKTPVEFQRILNNLEKLYISSYGNGVVAYLDNVKMKTAERNGLGQPADWVERCDSDGYLGSFAEMCAPGYTRDPPNGGAYAQCVPCSCNGHSITCDPETGLCDCLHNTMGNNCELCASGYYFGGKEVHRGTPLECQPCPCPENSTCLVIENGDVVCTNCPLGHAGPQCEICSDGWFGEPRGRGPCLECMCNGNTDENAVMNCNRTTGECLKCIHNTTGFHCESCLPGYFGKPISKDPEDRCRLCECDFMGSQHSSTCNPSTGKCECLPFVEGRRCDICRRGYWNINSGEGCKPCNCNLIGSRTGECNQDSGQCYCLPGVTGERCDRCLLYHFGLSNDGCTACNCNSDGSDDLQCGNDGKCVCRTGVYGDKCDQCQENFHDLVNGCSECSSCYSLVQNSVNLQRKELKSLQDLIENIGDFPILNNTQEEFTFRSDLAALNVTSYKLLRLMQQKQNQYDDLSERLDDVYERLQEMIMQLAGIEDNVDHCNETVQDASDANMKSKTDAKNVTHILQELQEKLAKVNLHVAKRISDESISTENNTTQLALEVQNLADRHELISNKIINVSQDVWDKSLAARDSIQNAIDRMDELITELELLVESENKIPAVKKMHEELLAKSKLVKNTTKEAKIESTNLFTKASKLSIKDFDTELLERTSQNILANSEKLHPILDDLEQQYKNNFPELKNNVEKAKDQLELALVSQKTADRLLAQADGSLEVASKAVKIGNASYDSIISTLNTLEDFDNQTNSNRNAVIAALKNGEEIHRKVDKATNITAQSKQALGAARAVAIQAREKALQAEGIADEIQTSAAIIRTVANVSHGQANNISEAVSTLYDQLMEANDELTAIESQKNKSEVKVSKIASDASRARTDASNAHARIDNILEQLRSLLDRINNSSDVSDDEIRSLEILYERIRNSMENFEIKATVEKLERNVNKQKRSIRGYNDEINKLSEDIVNLQNIQDILPESCSLSSTIEQS